MRKRFIEKAIDIKDNRGKHLIIPLLSFIFIFSISLVNAQIVDDGYQLEIYQYAGDCLGGGWEYSQNTGMSCDGTGRWDNSQTSSYITMLPDNALIPPLLASLENVSSADKLIRHVVKITDTTLSIWRYNSTYDILQQKDIITFAGAYTTLKDTHPLIVKFSDLERPTIIVPFATDILRYYEYNGTKINTLCTANYTGTGLVPAFDQIYNILLVMGSQTNEKLAVYDSGCNLLYGGSINDADGSHVSKFPIGLADFGDLATGESYHSLVYMSYDVGDGIGINIYDYNQSHMIDYRVDFDGDYNLGLTYSCNNGKCNSVFDENQFSVPIIYDANVDGFDDIIVAGEDTTLIGGNQYNIYAISHNGANLWDSADNTDVLDNCGISGLDQDFTLFQPTLSHHPDALISPTDYTVANVVIGACAHYNDPLTIYIETIDLYTGAPIVSNSFTVTNNLFQGSNSGGNTYLNNIVSYNFNSDDDEPEILIAGKLLNHNLNPEIDLNFATVGMFQSVGSLIPFDDTFVSDVQIILFNNQTTRFYRSGTSNDLPTFTAGGNTVLPSNENPICLNLSNTGGVSINYRYSDIDLNDIYIKWECDTNNAVGNNPIFDNYTVNYSIQDETNFNIYCKYNTTGTKTFKIWVSDEYHYNTTPDTYITDTFNLQIIDNVKPLCSDDYSTFNTLNPISTSSNTTDPTPDVTYSNTIQDYVATELGADSDDDRFILWIILMVLVGLGMATYAFHEGGRNAHFHLKTYFYVILFVEFLLLILGVKLGFIDAWILILILLIVAIIGAILFRISATGDK